MSMIDVTFVQEILSAGHMGGVNSREVVIHEFPNFPASLLPSVGQIIVFAPPDESATFPKWKVVPQSDGNGSTIHYYEHKGLVYAVAKIYVDRAELAND
jgi:hypothetical protein